MRNRKQTQKTISQLLTHRLTAISGALTRSAGLRYRREFDVSLGEWSALGLLGQDPQLTVNRLAARAGLDKAQMSRIVSKLVERGYVEREPGARRSTRLTLTSSGKDIYAGLLGAANERDAELHGSIEPAKMQIFEEVLEQLTARAREIEAAEMDQSPES
ncbi:MAG: MarR family transcriptional regulator [Mycetocola sp.]